MPKVLTTTAKITCPHGGIGTTTPATPLVDASGGIVTAEGDVGVLTCVSVPPCAGYTLVSMGLNASTIAERRVILSTDFQKSFTGIPLSIVETTTVVDDSSPGPLPAGATEPEASPAMLDVAPPVVLAVPPVVPFVTTTMLPPTALITFTLSAAYPLSWNLRLLNQILGLSIDATNGLPSGLAVVPAGGDWPSPSLTVTATLSAAFMASLTPGTHSLYMTGVTQRGISAFGVASLAVS